MNRLSQKKEDFLNAVDRLQEALEQEANELVIDGTLHRFEFTFELAWKLIKSYLEYMGITEITGSPRETIQNGFKQGIIENGEEWVNMMLSRNSLSHVYDEKSSREIYDKIKSNYINLFINLKQKVENI